MISKNAPNRKIHFSKIESTPEQIVKQSLSKNVEESLSYGIVLPKDECSHLSSQEMYTSKSLFSGLAGVILMLFSCIFMILIIIQIGSRIHNHFYTNAQSSAQIPQTKAATVNHHEIQR